MRICAIAFLLGILLVQSLAQLPSLWLTPLLALLAWLALRNPVWLVGLFFVSGVLWVTLRAGWILDDALPPGLERQDLNVAGFVADLPQSTERGVRFVFDIESAMHRGRVVQIPNKVLLNSYGDDERFVVGQRWRFVVRLRRPHGFQNPGGFDYEGHMFQQRIRAIGYIRPSEPAQLLSQGHVFYSVGRLRQWLGNGMRASLADNPLAGMMVALVNGDRRGVTNEQWRTLRRTGTNHLIAISGLHIGLIAGFAYLMTRLLWSLRAPWVLRWPAPKVGAVMGMIAAVLYAALAGFSVPTQRAMIMLAVVMGAMLIDRRVSPTRVLSVALLLVLIHDPLAVMGAGFWLSFAAVTVITVFLHGRTDGRSRWRRLGTMQLAIGIGLLPLTLVLFQQVSLIGPIANLFAVPFFGLLVVPATLSGSLALMFMSETLAGYILQFAASLLHIAWTILEYLAGFSKGVWAQHHPAGWAFACALIGIAVLLAPRGWPGRWVGAIWLLPMLLLRPPSPGAGEVWFTLLDVGQGLSAIVRTQHHTLVYDAGPRFSKRFDTGRAVVVPYLRNKGVDHIDMLIISDGDNDHIGGAQSVIEGLPVNDILTSVPAELKGARRCLQGQQWKWDAVDFWILHPPNEPRWKGNNASCLLAVSSDYGSILLPGDIEEAAEAVLVQSESLSSPTTILVAPHHGSRTSSTEGFVEAVQPQLVLFPVGYRNQFGHPNPRVRERYLQYGAQTYDSPTHGAIEVELGVTGTQVSPYREQTKRYWFSQ